MVENVHNIPSTYEDFQRQIQEFHMVESSSVLATLIKFMNPRIHMVKSFF